MNSQDPHYCRSVNINNLFCWAPLDEPDGGGDVQLLPDGQHGARHPSPYLVTHSGFMQGTTFFFYVHIRLGYLA
jgi:hypothetical protein